MTKGSFPRASKISQHLGLLGVTGHTLHLGLQLVSSKRPLPVNLQRLRVAQIILDLPFKVRLRHHRVERWLGAGVRVGPDPMLPVNVFDRSLIRDAIGEAQASARVSICAEGGVILRRESIWELLR